MGQSKFSLENSYYYGLEKPGTFGVSHRILRDIGTEIFKTHKIGTVLGNTGLMESTLIYLLAYCSIKNRD